MSYEKRVYTNSPDEIVTYEDMNRMEDGIESTDAHTTDENPHPNLFVKRGATWGDLKGD